MYDNIENDMEKAGKSKTPVWERALVE